MHSKSTVILNYIAIHSQKGTSCSKPVAGLLPCHHQANIMMRCLLGLDDNNSSPLQVVNGLDINIIETFYPQLDVSCFNNLQQVCKYQVATSLFFTDLLQLDEVNRLGATC